MNHGNSKSNPCTDKLTDLEYIIHMIPHHQVAIDMSNLLIQKTNAPILLDLCRQIIRSQSYEIWEMTYMKTYDGKLFTDDESFKENNNKTKLERFYPVLSKSKDGDCNPLFFKPNDHARHMSHTKITSEKYLKHMIPHHQVAVDMSKRLLLHTKNSYLYTFCHNLIRDQQVEIYNMKHLLKNTYSYKSVLMSSSLLGPLNKHH